MTNINTPSNQNNEFEASTTVESVNDQTNESGDNQSDLLRSIESEILENNQTETKEDDEQSLYISSLL